MLSSVPTSEECVNFQRHRFAPFNKRSSSPSPATELVANNSNQMASSSKKGKGKLKRRSEHASSSDDEDESDSQEEDGVLLSINNSSSSKSRNKRKAIRAIRPEQLSQAKMQQSRKQQEEEIQSRIRQQLAFQPRNTDSKKRNVRCVMGSSNFFLYLTSSLCSQIIINLGHDDNEEDIFISEYLATFLKDHQIEGVRFMWKNLIMIKQHDSGGALRYSGCILAHAMGLGKTLQVVTLIDTLMKQSKLASPVIPEHLKNLRVLVIIPAMLLTNWQHEFEKWIKNVGGSRAWDRLGGISSLKKSDSVDDQLKVARSWAESTHGVLLVGYELLRSLCTSASASRKRAVDEEHAAAVANDCNDAGDASGEDEDVGGGIDPREVWRQLLIEKGPTLVICDEAHKLKNHKSGISNILKTIKTSSRIGLTGSPLQNNLEEYWAMVDWVCPVRGVTSYGCCSPTVLSKHKFTFRTFLVNW